MRTKELMVPVSDLRDHLKEIIDRVATQKVLLVRHSRPVAVIVSSEHYEKLLDRIEDLEDELSVLHANAHPEQDVPWEQVKAEMDAERESVAV